MHFSQFLVRYSVLRRCAAYIEFLSRPRPSLPGHPAGSLGLIRQSSHIALSPCLQYQPSSRLYICSKEEQRSGCPFQQSTPYRTWQEEDPDYHSICLVQSAAHSILRESWSSNHLIPERDTQCNPACRCPEHIVTRELNYSRYCCRDTLYTTLPAVHTMTNLRLAL